jgi:lysophospholipase L1-like esterase
LASRLPLLVALLFCILAEGCALFEEPPIFQTEFEQDPAACGWVQLSLRDEPAECDWQPGVERPEQGRVVVRGGMWRSPPFDIIPFQYYELSIRFSVAGRGYWAVQFFDDAGVMLDADHYSCVEGAGAPDAGEFCFQGKPGASRARIVLRAMGGRPLTVDALTVRPVSRRSVARWADGVYRTMPRLEFTPPADRWKYLSLTMQKLRNDEPLTIVMLGDSIVNDMGNSGYETLIERRYGRGPIHVITSVKGGTGCQYYRQKGRVKQYVLDYKPDLLIIGGISHNWDDAPVRDVIRQVRAQSSCDIMVMTGAVTPLSRMLDDFELHSGQPRSIAAARAATFSERMRKMAEEEKVEFLDLDGIYTAYVEKSGRGHDWFMRDPVHANVRGQQVMARILERFFAP